MKIHDSYEEYRAALKTGQRIYKELSDSGRDPHPVVLAELLPAEQADSAQDIGLMEIPIERIVGTTAAGRVTAFTADFRPLLGVNSEFASKWMRLCDAHLSDEGIRDPIVCIEYLGNFYVQEGNKRVSVLRHFGSARIPALVRRVLPLPSDDPQIIAYQEFLDFFKESRLYTIRFRRPGDYGKLLGYLNRTSEDPWTEWERKTFHAYFYYFQEAFTSLNTAGEDILSEEALLLWLTIHPFRELGELTSQELKKSLADLWEDVVTSSQSRFVDVQTTPDQQPKPTLFERFISSIPNHLQVAFIYAKNRDLSAWTISHDEGRIYLEQALPGKVTTRTYFFADTSEAVEQLLEEAVADGADLVFTTTPQMSRSTLKAAIKHPHVRFLNCSVNIPYSSIRSYYSRIYEAKFITGAIAGTVAKNGKIGYVANYPIYGVPASINAFALGVQLTNPTAKLYLRWSCQTSTAKDEFLREGIRVISNRDIPSTDQSYLEHGVFGTYQMEDDGTLIPLSSPIWLWGKFYETVAKSILDGTWADARDPEAINYWWGMDSGVIDVELSEHIPEGVRSLAQILRKGLISGRIDPFLRKLVSQDGTIKNDGTHAFSPNELLHMDWLCDNVVGSIPDFDQLLPFAQQTVRELGVYRDRIPAEKEEDRL